MMIFQWLRKEHRQRDLLLLLALCARLLFLAYHFPYGSFSRGGDSLWYVQQGWLIVHHALNTPLNKVGPLYPLLLAALWAIFPNSAYPTSINNVPGTYVVLAGLIQILLSMLMVFLTYQLTQSLTVNHPASMITAIGVGLGPAFVMESSVLLTETVFMALLVLAVWLYHRALRLTRWQAFALGGFAFGLSALVRPILLLFPLFLVPHMLFSLRGRSRYVCLGALLGGFLLILLPWGIYMYRGTGSWIPQGFSSNLWIGSVGSGKFEGPQITDQLRQGMGDSEIGYIRQALKNIAEDPLHWAALRALNIAEAVLQPHGTDNLPNLQIKQMIVQWLKSDRSWRGLLAIVQIPDFWLRVLIYMFHYSALVFGLCGAWLSRRDWRRFYVLFSLITYFFLTYGALTILPRYLFPTQIFFWALAGIAMLKGWDFLHRQRTTSVIRNHGRALEVDQEV